MLTIRSIKVNKIDTVSTFIKNFKFDLDFKTNLNGSFKCIVCYIDPVSKERIQVAFIDIEKEEIEKIFIKGEKIEEIYSNKFIENPDILTPLF